MASEESPWEEEESVVLVELSGIIDNTFHAKDELKYKILGVETDKPVLQFENFVFVGDYQDTLGTAVLFEQKPPEAGSALSYKGQTFKKLVMQRAFVTEKSAEEEHQRAGSSSDSEKPQSTQELRSGNEPTQADMDTRTSCDEDNENLQKSQNTPVT